MSDPAAPATDATQAQQGVSFRLTSQYIKDLSFENPRAPQAFAQMGGTQPPVQVGVGVTINQLAERAYEVVLEVNAEAKHQNDRLFIAELSYAGLVDTQGPIAPEQLAPLLMIEIPRMLFPFARAILSDATRDGGFPPLMLAPVDFVALYRQRLAQAQAQAAGSATGTAPAAT